MKIDNLSGMATPGTTAGGIRGGARKRTIKRQENCVKRLQAVSGCVKTVDDILEEIFPFQVNYRLAESLVTPPFSLKKRTESSESIRPWATTPSAPVSHGVTTRKKRLALATPLQAIERAPQRWSSRATSPDRSSRSQTPTTRLNTDISTSNASTAARGQDQHTLALWEDKFRGRRLSPQDVLFLVTHDDVASVLESAGLVREADMTYDQLMELEVALESLREVRFVAPNEHPAVIRSKHEQLQDESSLYELLRDNVWLHGVAFNVKSSVHLATSGGTCAPSPRKGLLVPLSPAIERVATCPVLPIISSPITTRTPTKAKTRLATALPYDRKFAFPSRESDFEQEERSFEYRQRLHEAQVQSSASEKQYRQVGTCMPHMKLLFGNLIKIIYLLVCINKCSAPILRLGA